MLKKKIEFPDKWDMMLPSVVYAYIVMPHEAIGESPFFMLHGIVPVLPFSIIPGTPVSKFQVGLDDYRTEILRVTQAIREEVSESADAYKAKMKEV